MTYFKTACYLLIISAFLNVIGHFLLSKPINETELQLTYLMTTYQKNFAGGKMSPKEIQDGLNLIYALFFVFTGAVNLALIRNTKDTGVLKKINLINVTTFAIGTAISTIYFFWFPVALFATTTVCFLIAHIKFKQI